MSGLIPEPNGGATKDENPDTHPPSILTSSPRFSRGPLKPGFGQINIALDSAQDLVVDGFFVA